MCIGCKQCEQACAAENGLPYDDKIAAEEVTSAHKFTAVMTKTTSSCARLCMNCDEPACASVCPVAALQKDPAGSGDRRQEPLHGCRYCMPACPFSVPRYEWDKAFPGYGSASCAVRAWRPANQRRVRKLSHRRYQVRRPQRVAGRGPAAPPRQSRQDAATHLWRD